MIWVLAAEGGADGCRRRSVAVAGEIAASDRSSDGGWRQECVGHELSSPIDGMGHSRGWQPGSKVSMMIIRPPQQGQAFHSSVFVTIFGAVAVPARRGWVGYAEELAGQCDIVGPVAVGEEAVVTDAVKPVGQDMDQEAADELVGVERHQLVAGVRPWPGNPSI